MAKFRKKDKKTQKKKNNILLLFKQKIFTISEIKQSAKKKATSEITQLPVIEQSAKELIIPIMNYGNNCNDDKPFSKRRNLSALVGHHGKVGI